MVAESTKNLKLRRKHVEQLKNILKKIENPTTFKECLVELLLKRSKVKFSKEDLETLLAPCWLPHSTNSTRDFDGPNCSHTIFCDICVESYINFTYYDNYNNSNNNNNDDDDDDDDDE